jgi:hypothetical protein
MSTSGIRNRPIYRNRWYLAPELQALNGDFEYTFSSSSGTINGLKIAAGARTPKYRVTLNLGGGTRAASRSINFIGS